MSLFELIVTGGVAIGVITAIGLHSQQLATLAPAVGKATSGVTHTLETGN